MLLCVLVTQWCPTLCSPTDCNPPGSFIHGIFQARILDWIAISFSRRYSQPRDRTWVSHIADSLPSEPPRKLMLCFYVYIKLVVKLIPIILIHKFPLVFSLCSFVTPFSDSDNSALILQNLFTYLLNFRICTVSELLTYITSVKNKFTKMNAIFTCSSFVFGLPWWLNGKESSCRCSRYRFDPWVRKIPWRRIWQSTPVFFPGEFYGQRSLTGYSPWGLKELDMIEQLSTHGCFCLWPCRIYSNHCNVT